MSSPERIQSRLLKEIAMRKPRICRRCLLLVLLIIVFCLHCFVCACAFEYTTLSNGSTGEEVRELQQALIELGFLSGTADGIFGNKTENAVRKFQKKYKLTVDGLAGKTTREKIMDRSRLKSGTDNHASSAASPTVSTASVVASEKQDFSLSGNSTAIRYGSKGDRVKELQNALITLGFLNGKADGIYGKKTLNSVKSFQRSKKLTADGVAGKKTLSAIQSALQDSVSVPDTSSSETKSASPAPASDNEDLNPKIAAPSSVQLLHWFNDVKPSLSNGQKLLVYDPLSGYSWTLKILARGRHCDAEPQTAMDTRTMIKAFGGTNTWNQKAVYVQLPDGRWSLAATHDMPHDSGTVKDNGFNGHLCVHFLRDMDEARQNDPNYGVANQETIRSKWKSMTGEDVP